MPPHSLRKPAKGLVFVWAKNLEDMRQSRDVFNMKKIFNKLKGWFPHSRAKMRGTAPCQTTLVSIF